MSMQIPPSRDPDIENPIQINPSGSEPSKWNYVVPAVATILWIGAGAAAVAYINYQVHNYKYPENPINPDLVKIAKDAMISLVSLGGATIPISVGVTAVKAVYNSCENICSGIDVACKTGWDAIKNSCSPSQFLKPNGIIINTLAAPFAVPIGLCALLRRN